MQEVVNNERLKTSGASVNAIDLMVVMLEHRNWLLLLPLLVGLVAGVISMALPNVFTAWTVIMPPQQQQSAGLAALQSLGNLAGLAGGGAGSAAGIKNPLDQYASLMYSNTITDRIVVRHKLVEAYRVSTVIDARDILIENVRIVPGKKDGLMTIEVDDTDPKRAAAIANEYVPQLLKLTSDLAITEAQQRRQFFEKQIQGNKEKLIAAQQALQQSGINQSVMRAEPKAAAEGYAALKAQVTAEEVRLQSMRSFMTEDAPEFRRAQSTLSALQLQLKRYETNENPEQGSGSDYINKYREFKYQEALFELFSKQYEMARLDESRDAALIQVIDPATPPDRKSKPRRFLIVGVAMLVTELLLLLILFSRKAWHIIRDSEKNRASMARLHAALGRRS